MIKDYLKDLKNFLKQETKLHVFVRYLLVIFLIVFYFLFISQKYGKGQGFLITVLTWSFFVFCTPIADAGFLFDFPFRLITHLRMIYSELSVWVIAATINILKIGRASCRERV